MKFFVLRTLQARLVRTLVIAVAIIAATFFFVWRLTIEPALKNGVARQQKETAEHAAGDIGEFIQHRVQQMIAVGEIVRLWEMKSEEQKKSLYRLMKLDPEIREIAIADVHGRETLRLSRLRVYTKDDLAFLGSEEKFRRPASGESYIGPVYHDVTAEPLVTLAVPIRFTPKEIRGVLLAEVSLKNLWTSIASIKVGHAGYTFVVDRAGDLIAHPDYSKVLLKLNYSSVSTIADFLNKRNAGVGVSRIRKGSNGAAVIANYATVAEPMWAVVVEEPVETALAEVKQVKEVALFILAFTLVGVFSISYVFSQRIARPVRELEQGASLIAQGAWDQKLDIRTGDELEGLAQRFNEMAEALKKSYAGLEEKITERTRDLSALYATLAPLGSSNADQLLHDVLERLKEATQADAILIRIFDKETKTFPHKASIGFPENFLASLRPVAKDSVTHAVFTSGEPMIIADIASHPRLTTKRHLTAGLLSAAFLPLEISGEIRGVIHLASRKLRGFTEHKTEHLMTIAHQMGVAMHNRELFEEAQNRLRRIHALREIDLAISSTLDVRNVLDILMDKIDLVLPHAAVTVRLLDKDRRVLRPVACRNLDETEWRAGPWTFGRGLASIPLETQSPLIIRNVLSDPRVRDLEFYRKHNLRSYVGVPLIVKEQSLGVLGFYSKDDHEFTNEDVDFLATLAAQAAVAIHNSQLFERSEDNLARVRALREIDLAITSTLETSSVLGLLLEKINVFLPFHAATVRLYNRETKNLDVIAAKNIDEQLWKDHSHETGRRAGSYAWTVFESKQPLAISNIARDSATRRAFLQQQGIISFLGVPLIVKEETLGVLTLYSRMEREFRPEEIEFLSTVAGQAAIAIHNAQLYAELRKQAAALAKSNRIKDEFLSVMSHELRTPLSGIIGYTGLIRDKLIGPTTSKQNEALDKLMNRAKDLMAMISSILFATSIDADEVRVIRSKFSAVDLLNDLKTDYELPSQKTVAFRWDYPANLPALTTDREKLKSILQNLINNAVKFTLGGAISVEARMLGKTNGNGNGSKSGDFIEFKIADTGIGIPEAKLGVIFEKFRQVDGSETRLFGGVGLGLYIAKSFTELLEGDIKVASKEGRGSIFTVKIPCGMDEEAEAQPGTGRDPRPEPKA